VAEVDEGAGGEQPAQEAAEQDANSQRSHAPSATGGWTRPLAGRLVGPEMPRKKPRPRISPEERAYTTEEVARHLNVSHSIGLSGDAPILSPYA
jgi:hypothetical protein